VVWHVFNRVVMVWRVEIVMVWHVLNTVVVVWHMLNTGQIVMVWHVLYSGQRGCAALRGLGEVLGNASIDPTTRVTCQQHIPHYFRLGTPLSCIRPSRRHLHKSST